MADLNEEERANLVAYLDGELDEETARDIETRLGLDPAMRAEADALQQTWGMLDYLPRPQPPTDFTQRTMERLALARPASTGIMALRPAARRWLGGLAWAAVILLALGGGFGASRLLWPPTREPNLEENLVRHLRVVENLHLYERVDDLEFLRSLDHPDLFGDESGGD